jgi:hypothetical protein
MKGTLIFITIVLAVIGMFGGSEAIGAVFEFTAKGVVAMITVIWAFAAVPMAFSIIGSFNDGGYVTGCKDFGFMMVVPVLWIIAWKAGWLR